MDDNFKVVLSYQEVKQIVEVLVKSQDIIECTRDSVHNQEYLLESYEKIGQVGNRLINHFKRQNNLNDQPSSKSNDKYVAALAKQKSKPKLYVVK
jgi:hypothetical protein